MKVSRSLHPMFLNTSKCLLAEKVGLNTDLFLRLEHLITGWENSSVSDLMQNIFFNIQPSDIPYFCTLIYVWNLFRFRIWANFRPLSEIVSHCLIKGSHLNCRSLFLVGSLPFGFFFPLYILSVFSFPLAELAIPDWTSANYLTYLHSSDGEWGSVHPN